MLETFLKTFGEYTLDILPCFLLASMIPIARTIEGFSRRSYAPVISFLVTAPTLSPVVLFLTFGVFGWEIATLRILSVVLFALILSAVVHLLFAKRSSLLIVQGSSPGGTGTFPERFGMLFASSPISYPLIGLVAVPLCVCSGEEVPIAKSFYDLGLRPGQALTFMLASTGVCIPTIAALWSFLPKGVVVLYTVSWLLFSASAGVLTDAVLN